MNSCASCIWCRCTLGPAPQCSGNCCPCFNAWNRHLHRHVYCPLSSGSCERSLVPQCQVGCGVVSIDTCAVRVLCLGHVKKPRPGEGGSHEVFKSSLSNYWNLDRKVNSLFCEGTMELSVTSSDGAPATQRVEESLRRTARQCRSTPSFGTKV